MAGKGKKEKKDDSKISGQIRGVWGLICSLSSIDQEKNNISLFNVINQLNVRQIDFERMVEERKEALLIPAQHELVLMFRRLGNHELFDNEIKTDSRISLVGPSGKVLAQVLTPMEFKPKIINCRHRVFNDGFKLVGPGDYEYRVEVLQPGSEKFTEEMIIPFFVRAS